MGTVTGFTAERMLDIENGTVVAGLVDLNGDLLLTKRSGEVMNAGRVRGQDFDPTLVPSANTVDKGITRYSTLSENEAGTLNEAAVTPLGMKTFVDDALADLDPEGTIVPWANITNKPSTFPASPHTHQIEDILASTFPPSAHNHTASDISSGVFAAARLPAATESAIGAVERATQAEVNAGTDSTRYVSPLALATRLSLIPAPVTDWADLTGKPSTFPPSSHTHPWSEITDGGVRVTNLGDVAGGQVPSWYPDGLSYGSAAEGFPASIGTVMNIRHSAYRQFQQFYDRSANTRVWIRASNGNDLWADWREILTDATGSFDWASITGKPSTFPPSSHSHSASDITSGTLSLARGGTGGTTAASARTSLGLGSAATLDATAGNVANSVVQRNASGQIGIGNPTSGIHATTKSYVDGLLAAGVTLPTVKAGGFTISVWNRNITGNRRAAWITDANTQPTELGHTSSAERFKQDIEAFDVPDETVMALVPVLYRYIEQVELHGEDAPWDFGLIAERLIEAGMPWAVFYDEDGSVQGIHYERAWIALIPAVKRMLDRVSTLEQKLNSIEARLAALEG